MTKTKPHNKAHTILHNYWLNLVVPEFRQSLKASAIERVVAGIDQWELTTRHDLKRLDSYIIMMDEIYRLSKEKEVSFMEWIPQLRERFIKKCLDYFNRRIKELRDDIEVQRNDDKKVVNVSKSHIKKYEERIKIYSLWLNQQKSANIVEPQ